MSNSPTLTAGGTVRRWPPWIAPAALLTGFAATLLLGSLIVVAVWAVTGESPKEGDPTVVVLGTLLQNVALITAAVLFMRQTSRPSLADLGFRRARFWRSAGGVVLVWIGFGVVTAVWLQLIGATDTRDDIRSQLGLDRSTLALLAGAFLVTVVAPFAEELFFRGFFFTVLRGWRGPWVAAVLTGALFGLIHGGSSPGPFILPLAVLGFGLCLLYWKTDSLTPCIALHALNNSIAFGVGMEWDWQIPVLIGCVAVVLTAVLAVLVRRQSGGLGGTVSVMGTSQTFEAEQAGIMSGPVSSTFPVVYEDARQHLVQELKAHALILGEVVLTSGKTASYYVDVKRAILLPKGFAALSKLVAARTEELGATAVGGLTMGADPVACAALAGGAQVKAFFVRKEEKQHGLSRLIEGPLLTVEDRCLIVEDVVTTGGSTVKAIEAVKSAGYTVCGVVSVLDRLSGGRERIESAAGAPYIPLTTIDEVYPERSE